jgi:hypothetical protein
MNDDSNGTQGGNIVTVQSIEEIAGVVPHRLIERLLEACQVGGRGGLYSRVGPVVEDIVAEGWSAGGIINQVRILPSSLFPSSMARLFCGSPLSDLINQTLSVKFVFFSVVPVYEVINGSYMT